MDNQKAVERINTLACQILEKGGDDKDLLVGLIEFTNDFYQVMKTASQDEINSYCENYPGFYSYAKVLGDLAALSSQGKLTDFLKGSEEKIKEPSSSGHSNTNRKSIAELQQIMAQSLLQIRDLVVLDTESSDQAKVIPTITVFLLSVISTAADLVEMTVPGGSTYLYAEVEAGVKNGGIRSIVKAMGENSPHYYSVSGIESDDIEAAMSYVGQELAVTLTKALHELPMPLRTSETQLRGIETLITNLLCQRFTNPHEVLDSLCDHVHTALSVLGKNLSVHMVH